MIKHEKEQLKFGKLGWIIVPNIFIILLQIWVLSRNGDYGFLQPEAFWLDTSLSIKLLVLNLFAIPATYIQFKILGSTDYKKEKQKNDSHTNL